MGLLVFLLIGGGIWLILSEKARRQADPFTFETDQELFQESKQSGADLPRHLRPTPEAQPGSYFDGGCILLFSLFWTSISLFFLIFPLVMFWQELQDYVLLKNTGQTAEAVIIDRRIDYDSEGDDYYVTYQFTAPLPQGDRKQFSREQSVDRDTYDNLPPESRITVVYAPSDPIVSRPLDWLGPPYYLLFIAALGSLFVVFGVILFISGWQGIAKSRKLSRRGQLIQGTLIDRWTDQDSDGDPVYCIAFEFTLPGRPHVTRAEYNREAYDLLEIGDPVSVRYLPDQPHICRLEL
jgi:hypothetical protein